MEAKVDPLLAEMQESTKASTELLHSNIALTHEIRTLIKQHADLREVVKEQGEDIQEIKTQIAVNESGREMWNAAKKAVITTAIPLVFLGIGFLTYLYMTQKPQ